MLKIVPTIVMPSTRRENNAGAKNNKDATDPPVKESPSMILSLAVIRLADADILPFQYANLVDTLRTYDEELQVLVKKKREEITERRDRAGSHLTEAALSEARERVHQWTGQHSQAQ